MKKTLFLILAIFSCSCSKDKTTCGCCETCDRSEVAEHDQCGCCWNCGMGNCK